MEKLTVESQTGEVFIRVQSDDFTKVFKSTNHSISTIMKLTTINRLPVLSFTISTKVSIYLFA